MVIANYYECAIILGMKAIKKTYTINAPIEKVWQALTDPKMIDAWGGGPAKMAAAVGTKFEFWGGDIHGENIEVIPNKKLVQHWYEGNWKKPSTATFTLEPNNGRTTLVLVHENVPAASHDDINEGWDQYYLDPLKDYVEEQ